MFPDIKEYLDETDTPYLEISKDLNRVIPLADVVYWTRTQKERITNPEINIEQVMKEFVIDKQMVSLMKPYSVLLHPLPRNNEISPKFNVFSKALC